MSEQNREKGVNEREGAESRAEKKIIEKKIAGGRHGILIFG